MNAVKRNRLIEDKGVALFAALAFLLIFSMLGTAYIRFMQISYRSTSGELQGVRAEHLSRGGTYAAIGEIQTSLERGEIPGKSYEIKLPVYRTVEGEEAEFPQTVSVTISDESGKVNLNLAPSAVLKVLGIPEKVVAQIHGHPLRGERKVLTSVDELRTADYMSGQNYNELDKSLFTVYTSASDGLVAPINLNSANSTVLAAIFAIDLEEAETLSQKRPFTSWEDVLVKVGREPSTFNVVGGRNGNSDIPVMLSLKTRTFRINSNAHMVTRDTTSNGLYTSVESVVHFESDGSFSIRYWDESSSGDLESEIVVSTTEVVSPVVASDESE